MNNKVMIEVKIDVLIGEVMSRLDEVFAYFHRYQSYDTRFHSEEENAQFNYYEHNSTNATNFIYDICSIFDMDMTRLLSMVRTVRKWNEKCNYQFCFPYENCADFYTEEHFSKSGMVTGNLGKRCHEVVE